MVLKLSRQNFKQLKFRERVLLRQLRTLFIQCLPLCIEGAAPQSQLVAATQELFALDETRLIEIGKSPTLGGDRVDLAYNPVCAASPGGEGTPSLSCLPSR